jgi:hypothetical protein
VKTKHRKTLEAVFAQPTLANIAVADIESLVKALDGEVVEREGSRVVFDFGDAVFHMHRPHPGNTARKYQIEELRIFLTNRGIAP